MMMMKNGNLLSSFDFGAERRPLCETKYLRLELSCKIYFCFLEDGDLLELFLLFFFVLVPASPPVAATAVFS